MNTWVFLPPFFKSTDRNLSFSYKLHRGIKMDKFWNKIRRSLAQQSTECDGDGGASTGGGENCIMWTSDPDRHGYGRKQVTWPNGSKKRERAHRVSYFLHHKLLSSQVPNIDRHGNQIDVSHRCHKKLCINPQHLTLESHSNNMLRNACAKADVCTNEHAPPSCIFKDKVGKVRGCNLICVYVTHHEKNGSIAVDDQCSPRPACASAQSDLGLHWSQFVNEAPMNDASNEQCRSLSWSGATLVKTAIGQFFSWCIDRSQPIKLIDFEHEIREHAQNVL